MNHLTFYQLKAFNIKQKPLFHKNVKKKSIMFQLELASYHIYKPISDYRFSGIDR